MTTVLTRSLRSDQGLYAQGEDIYFDGRFIGAITGPHSHGDKLKDLIRRLAELGVHDQESMDNLLSVVWNEGRYEQRQDQDNEAFNVCQ